MRNLGRILGQIPARGGSKRLPAKNLRYLYGKPLIAEGDFHQAEVMLHARKMAAGKVESPRYWAPKEGIASFAHKT